MQNEAVANYGGDLDAISREIKDLKAREAEATAAVKRQDKKVHRFHIDADVAKKHMEACPVLNPGPYTAFLLVCPLEMSLFSSN